MEGHSIISLNSLPEELIAIIIQDNYPEVNRLTCKLWYRLSFPNRNEPDVTIFGNPPIVRKAIENDHVNVLKWTHSLGRPYRHIPNLMYGAVVYDAPKTLEWLYDLLESRKDYSRYNTIRTAINYSSINVLNWLKLDGAEMTAAMEESAGIRSVKSFDWAVNHGAEITYNSFVLAVAHRRIPILNRMYECCPVDVSNWSERELNNDKLIDMHGVEIIAWLKSKCQQRDSND